MHRGWQAAGAKGRGEEGNPSVSIAETIRSDRQLKEKRADDTKRAGLRLLRFRSLFAYLRLGILNEHRLHEMF